MKKVDKDKLLKTYGLFKFKVPSKEEQISAMNLAGESTLFKKLIALDYEKFYETIPSPDIGDWLMDHKEYGQTHDEYMRSGIVPVEGERNVIYLAPLSCGENANIDQGFVNGLLLMCEAYFYGMKVRLIDKSIDLNNYSIDIRIYDDTKIQINANQILTVLYQELPPDAYSLIAFTDKDLFSDSNVIKPRNYIDKPNNTVTNSISFCYGLSSIKNRVGVFSFARYDPLFYTTIVKKDSQKQQERLMKYYFILLKRACKVILKEICHMFGLRNCTFFLCNLNGFNSMEEFDRRPLEVCPVCFRKLYTNITLKSANVTNVRIHNPLILYDRFIKMKNVLSENFLGIFDSELEWYNTRVESLKNEI